MRSMQVPELVLRLDDEFHPNQMEKEDEAHEVPPGQDLHLPGIQQQEPSPEKNLLVNTIPDLSHKKMS